MYVCLCNAISDTDLRRAASEGAKSVDSAYERLGAKVQCGRCRFTAAEILNSRPDGSVYDPASTVLAAE